LPARADGGLLQTIEVEPRHADFAEAWIARSDVADRVEVLRGAGAEVLAKLPDRSFDAAFLDADKTGYPTYLEHCLRVVRSGGMILVDNAFAFGQLFDEHPTDGEVPAVRAFNDQMARTPGLHGVIVPLGDGLWVSVIESEGEER
jgi:predicted O-methyltransferase YrrM